MGLLLFLGVFLGAALVSGLAVAGSIRVAERVGAHDHPDGERKTQERPMPRLGGLAVAVAFTACALAVLLFAGRVDTLALGLGVLAPALVGSVIGYVDDLRHINPPLRLLLQAGTALLAWFLGTRIEVTGVALLDLVVTVGWFMVVVNGINLLDNSDGLAGSTVLVSAIGASVIALIFGQELVSLLGFALAGVCLGYLWHNWHPARVYMGDSGAYFLGFLLAALVIRLRPETLSPLVAAVIALLLVALPLLDTSYVVLKRMRAGIHPFTAGRDHLAHVIQDKGRSVPFSVLSLQLVLVSSTVVAVGIAALQA